MLFILTDSKIWIEEESVVKLNMFVHFEYLFCMASKLMTMSSVGSRCLKGYETGVRIKYLLI